MKKTFVLASLICFAVALQAQVKVGFLAGLNTTDLEARDLFDNGESLKLSIKDADYGFHFGLFAQAKVGKIFYLQPEVVFNSTKVDFQVQDLSNNLPETVLTEKYNNLDIPVLFGLKLGPLRVGTGPVAHVFLNSNSELTEVEGYEQNFEKLKFGWQTGVGLNIWKFIVDLKWEKNFDNFGDHIVINDTPYSFNQTPNKLVFSLGYTF